MQNKMNLSEGRLLALQIAREVAHEFGMRYRPEGEDKLRQIWKSTVILPADGGWSLDVDIDNSPRHLSIRIVFPTSPDFQTYWFEAKAIWPYSPARLFLTSLVHGTIRRDDNGELTIGTFIPVHDRSAHLMRI